MNTKPYQSLPLPELNSYNLELFNSLSEFGTKSIRFRFDGASGNILHIYHSELEIRIQRALAISSRYNLRLRSRQIRVITDGPDLTQPGGRSYD